jgi:hypothetical protein
VHGHQEVAEMDWSKLSGMAKLPGGREIRWPVTRPEDRPPKEMADPPERWEQRPAQGFDRILKSRTPKRAEVFLAGPGVTKTPISRDPQGCDWVEVHCFLRRGKASGVTALLRQLCDPDTVIEQRPADPDAAGKGFRISFSPWTTVP